MAAASLQAVGSQLESRVDFLQATRYPLVSVWIRNWPRVVPQPVAASALVGG